MTGTKQREVGAPAQCIGDMGFGSSEANIVIARLRERRNESAAALAVVRRRRYHHGVSVYFRSYTSTMLREEGGLARALGDSASAVRAYTHYLALRANAEPALMPQVAAVCAELRTLAPLSHGSACSALASR